MIFSHSTLTLLASLLAVAGTGNAAAVATANLTATGSVSQCKDTFPSSFGIVIAALPTSTNGTMVPASTTAATVVNQITDGQVQAPTTEAKVTQSSTSAAGAVTQIGDGQVQAPGSTSTPTASSAAGAVTQIGDGQIQAPGSTSSATPSASSAAGAVTQIGDGQIQAPGSTSSATPSASSAAGAVTQIGDGQIQAPGSSSSTPAASSASGAVTQIGDGQVQAPGSTSAATASSAAGAVTQISDGQVQAETGKTTFVTSTIAAASTIEVSTGTASSVEVKATDGATFDMAYVCATNSTLSMTLKDGILKDSKGRIGYIASNNQFQFDNPVQDNAIVAKGFGACHNGTLSLGGSTVFWACKSGAFSNLYDKSIGGQCEAVQLNMVSLEKC